MRNIILLFGLGLLLSTGTMAQDINYKKLGVEEKSVDALVPLEIGADAPDFSFNLAEEEVMLSEYIASHPVVLVFYRGHWCPLCNRHLSAFQEELYLLEEKGYKVLAITPQEEEYIDKTIEKTNLEIPVISDKGGEIMKAYQVAFEVTDGYEKKIKTVLFTDIASSNGTEEASLPVPATYVIGKDQKIEYVHFDPNYKNRATVNDILEGIAAK